MQALGCKTAGCNAAGHKAVGVKQWGAKQQGAKQQGADRCVRTHGHWPCLVRALAMGVVGRRLQSCVVRGRAACAKIGGEENRRMRVCSLAWCHWCGGVLHEDHGCVRAVLRGADTALRCVVHGNTLKQRLGRQMIQFNHDPVSLSRSMCIKQKSDIVTQQRQNETLGHPPASQAKWMRGGRANEKSVPSMPGASVHVMLGADGTFFCFRWKKKRCACAPWPWIGQKKHE